MSDDLYFQLFYGSGGVRYGPEGVDLSEFSSITKKYPELERGLGFQYPIGYLKRCVPNISRDYETFGQRYWCCKNIDEVQKRGATSQV